MCASPTPLEYLEYDEEDDDIFGFDIEETSGPSKPPLPAYNPAKPINRGAPTPTTAKPVPASISRKGKERVIIRDPQDRLDELRFMRISKQPKGTGKGAQSLKIITQNGEMTIAAS
jgi:hypothetical protein